jgi:soluble lytic murein transglycosylase
VISTGGRRRVRVWSFRPRVLARLLGVLGALALLFLGARAAAYAAFPFPYRPAVLRAAAESGLDPRLVLAVMRVESRFRPDAVSPAGAVGLMQVTPPTGAWIAGQRGEAGFSPALLRRPEYNVAAGSWYLAHLIRTFGGRLPPAVAAYNAGTGAVEGWLQSGRWDASAAGASAIPYPETRLFVQRVLATYGIYRALYPGVGGGRQAPESLSPRGYQDRLA